MSDKIGTLLKQSAQGEWQALAQLLTEIERAGASSLSHKELLEPAKPAFRIGITGPPGAGKSTLVGQLIKSYREQGLSVAVLAVDPSSPFTKGAILGDRIRFSEFVDDHKVFVRSLGSRGSTGGLSTSAYLMLRALDHYGFDVVIIETVGVGQSELDVMYVADQIAVVLVPESGDSIQAMKAGLLEIADVFVVNKADRLGADQVARELETLEKDGQHVKVFKTIATQGVGHLDVIAHLETVRKKAPQKQNRKSPDRLKWEARELLRGQVEKLIADKVKNVSSAQDLPKILDKI